jgi:hypothetical protein
MNIHPFEATHRHIKSGGLYQKLGEGKMQSHDWKHEFTLKSIDMTRVVIYQAQDGSYWVRPKAEFEDGRFEEIK